MLVGDSPRNAGGALMGAEISVSKGACFYVQVVGEEKMGPVAWFIPIFVACSTFGCVNGLAFSGAR